MFQFEEYSRSPGINWKCSGIELKLSEFIENLDVEEFSYPKMVLFLERLMTSVIHLFNYITTNHMIPML